jgi:cysteine-rich repeat protein
MHRLAHPAALLLQAAALGCAPSSSATSDDTDTTTASTSTSTTDDPAPTSSATPPGTSTSTEDTGGEGTGTGSDDTGAPGTDTSGPPPAPFCGDGHVDPGEGCDDGNDDRFDGCLPDCTGVPEIDAPTLEWKYFEVPGTQCMNGSTAGFGISHNPDSPDLMIYLEGGGACFNDVCDFSAFNIPFIPPPDGIFNRNNPGNPVKDWSMIYVPYCTGDIHGGDRDTELGGQVRTFRGYRNITRYLELWVPKFADAERVLLTGISAGGFGAGLNALQVADAFGQDPQIIVIDDSGPPMANDVIPPCLQQTFRDVWGLDDTVLAACGGDCPDPNNFPVALIDHTFKIRPDIRFGLFSNTADLVIRGFMSFGYGNGQHDTCDGIPTIVPADTYEGGLLDLRDHYADNASTYYIGQTQILYNLGQGHTVLRSPSFWTTIIDGVQLSDWVAKVIDGDVQHVGP